MDVIVLIGANTFSSALMNASDLKSKANATLYGNETGGNLIHFGQIKQLQIEDYYLFYSTKQFHLSNTPGPLRPDVEIMQSYSDFINGIDSVLKAL
ncbi:MAG: hypothetical protein GX903_10110 [Spirochaetales bacterium]|nr:hypothetical protein [Spirochaetales bacterium]